MEELFNKYKKERDDDSYIQLHDTCKGFALKYASEFNMPELFDYIDYDIFMAINSAIDKFDASKASCTTFIFNSIKNNIRTELKKIIRLSNRELLVLTDNTNKSTSELNLFDRKIFIDETTAEDIVIDDESNSIIINEFKQFAENRKHRYRKNDIIVKVLYYHFILDITFLDISKIVDDSRNYISNICNDFISYMKYRKERGYIQWI